MEDSIPTHDLPVQAMGGILGKGFKPWIGILAMGWYIRDSP